MTSEAVQKLHSKRLGRELAMQYLFRCDMLGETPDMKTWDEYYQELEDAHELKENRYARKGREYAEQLFTLVALNREEVDRAISARSAHWNMDRMSLVDRNIMRVSVAEMLFVADVPPVVSIDEAIGIARDYSGEDVINFINGVLNAIKDTLQRPAREKQQ